MIPRLEHPPHQHGFDEEWFYHRGGVQHGPLSRESLAETLRLLPSIEVLVWHAGLADWASPAEAQVRALIYGAGLAPAQPSSLRSLLFSFEGRLGRARYFWTYCLSMAAYIAAVMAALAYMHVTITSETGTLIRLTMAPPFMWIGLALTAKRLHDIDVSALHLLWMAPLICGSACIPPGPISLAWMILSCGLEIWLLLKRGTPGLRHYARDPLFIGRDYVFGKRPKQGRGLNVYTIASLLFLAGAGALLAYGGRALEAVRSSQSLCSDPGVLKTLGNLIGKDPNWIIIGAYYGSFSNIRISFHSIRTLEEGNPVHGSTCAAMMNVSAIDKSKVGIAGDRDLSDLEYTVQYVDGSSTEYVVNVVH